MTMLNIGDFKNNVDLYSADLSRWPVDDVKPALLLIENSSFAREYFEAALKNDAALRLFAPAPRDLGALESRIMATIAKIPQYAEPVTRGISAINWSLRDLFAPGSGLVAAAVIGFVIGLTPAPSSGSVLDAAFYNGDTVIAGDAEIYEGDIF